MKLEAITTTYICFHIIADPTEFYVKDMGLNVLLLSNVRTVATKKIGIYSLHHVYVIKVQFLFIYHLQNTHLWCINYNQVINFIA
jgi:hypothetical protein